jgi:hypothetical protein
VEIFKSAVGKSREKDFQEAYKEALDNVFKTITLDNTSNLAKNSESKTQEINTQLAIKEGNRTNIILDKNENNLLYAQPTSYGYQLIDSEPKVILKVYKTSNSVSFIASKGTVQGVLVARENQWFFEYYQNDKLISELINVKF